MTEPVQLNPPTAHGDVATQSAGLLHPIARKPDGQTVRIAVVAESVVDSVEFTFQCDLILAERQQTRLQWLGLTQREAIEGQVIEVGLHREPARPQLQHQRIRVRAPDHDVVADPAAARRVEVHLHAKSFFRNHHLPEQAVSHSAARLGTMSQVILGAEKTEIIGYRHPR